MKSTLCSLILCIAVALPGCKQDAPTAKAPPPPTVPVYVAKTQKIPIYQEFVGQLYGYRDIPIRARVEGFLEEIHFQEGATVKEGDLLYTVESQTYRENVAAMMSKVAEAKTMLVKAKSDLDRTRPLAARKAVSQSDLDRDVAQYEAAQASLEAAEANLRAAKIQLGYTQIYSPITGIIGKTRAKVGEFVGRNPNPVILNEVSDTSTMLVQFFITESQYLDIFREQARRQAAGEEGRKDETEIQLILADGSLYPQKGTFDFIDRSVDPTTGAILLQVSFPNPDGLLRPGQFGRIRAKVDVLENGIMIPQRCVSELQGTYSVYVVTNENTVEKRDVTVGPTVQNFWVIETGLQPEEKVVYEGLQRIAAGAKVDPKPQDVKLLTSEDR